MARESNADLQPELLSSEQARDLLASYAKAEELAAYGKTMLANKLDDALRGRRRVGNLCGQRDRKAGKLTPRDPDAERGPPPG